MSEAPETTTPYDDIEAGIKSVLEAEGSPFATVETGLDNLGDQDLADVIHGLANANRAPAAAVLYMGGDTNEGQAGMLREDGIWFVIVIEAGRSRKAAVQGDARSSGVRALLQWVRAHLHNATGIEGIVNPLLWMGNERFRIPEVPLSVAAFVAKFRAPMYYPDGPVEE